MLLLAVFGAGLPATASGRPPNVVRFASQNVRFTQAYAACHVCSPTRASIVTGKYPAELHVTDWLPGRRNFPFQKLNNAPVRQHLSYRPLCISARNPGITDKLRM